MANESSAALAGVPILRPTQAYTMAAVCLAAGFGIGYLLQGWSAFVPWAQPSTPTGAAVAPASGGGKTRSAVPLPPGQSTARAVPPGHPAMGAAGGKMPTLEDLKRMADKQAAPLLEQLKRDPRDGDVLVKVGAIYHSTHQFKEAATFYERAVQVDPKNVATRTRLASSLYRGGNVDGAIEQLNRALSNDPNDANALFDLGMIRLQGKQDGKGALAAWRHLLKSNPQMSSDRRATVEKLMADVSTSLNDRQARAGGPGK